MIIRRIRQHGAEKLRALLSYHDEILYHRAQNSIARRAYDAIIGQDPERRLSDKTRKTVRDYAQSVFGSPVFAPWLETYTAYRGAFHEGWIPDNYVGQVLVKRGCQHYLSLGQKTIALRSFPSELFPDLVYGINGGIYDRNFEYVAPGDVAAIVFTGHDTAFLKLENSSQGLGVFRLKKKDFDLDRALGLGNFVIQSPVEQHPFFDPFSPGGVATVRLLTVKTRGRPAELRAAYLRAGRASELLVRPDRQVRLPIDLASGALHPVATYPDWTRSDRHPDTGASFAGASIPAFSRAVEACLALHDRVPHVLVIGWDTCITPEAETRIFEVNTRHPGVRFAEAAMGPVFLGLGLENMHRTPDGAEPA